MIESFSTLIQFLSAIYLTLSFDNILFRGLWSMKYVPPILNEITKLVNNKSLETEIKEKIKSNANLIEKQSRNRGIFVLIYCLFIMICMGIEKNECNSVAFLPIFYLKIAFVSIIVIICTFLSQIWHKRIIFTFIIWTIVIFLFIITDFNISTTNIWIIRIQRNIGYLILSIILIPLFYQLYINWLYSIKYYGLLVEKIRNEHQTYTKAMQASCPEDVPTEYKDAITKTFFQTQSTPANQQDIKVSNILFEFKKRLLVSIQIPSFYTISKFALKTLFKREELEIPSYQESQINGEEIPIPSSQEENKDNDDYLRGKVTEYESITIKPAIRDYCKENGIDEISFKKMRAKILSKQSRQIKYQITIKK